MRGKIITAASAAFGVITTGPGRLHGVLIIIAGFAAIAFLVDVIEAGVAWAVRRGSDPTQPHP